MTTELKPCPFCGGEAEWYGEEYMVWVRCSNHECQAGQVLKFDEPEEAAKAWNRRAPLQRWTKDDGDIPDGVYLGKAYSWFFTIMIQRDKAHDVAGAYPKENIFADDSIQALYGPIELPRDEE